MHMRCTAAQQCRPLSATTNPQSMPGLKNVYTTKSVAWLLLHIQYANCWGKTLTNHGHGTHNIARLVIMRQRSQGQPVLLFNQYRVDLHEEHIVRRHREFIWPRVGSERVGSAGAPPLRMLPPVDALAYVLRHWLDVNGVSGSHLAWELAMYTSVLVLQYFVSDQFVFLVITVHMKRWHDTLPLVGSVRCCRLSPTVQLRINQCQAYLCGVLLPNGQPGFGEAPKVCLLFG